MEYYEAGLNGTVRLHPKLSVSAQGLARDAGATDDGGVRLDYAFADYRVYDDERGQFGLRLGRVRNPSGLFNDTRDVVFTRPGILLPLSVYYETLGARVLLFSSNGMQAYGSVALGDHYLSAGATFAPDRNLDERQEEVVTDGNLADMGEIRLRQFRAARLQDEWMNGRWTAGLSYFHGSIEFLPNQAVTTNLNFNFDFDLYVLSARFNAERYAITGEYSALSYNSRGSFGGPPVDTKATADGFYLQGEYFVAPRWTAMLRYDLAFADQADRDGSECSLGGSGSAPRSQCYSRDLTTGVNWRPNDHWGFWAEHHWIDGTYNASAKDNDGRTLEPHWSMLLLMAAYRF